MVMEFKNTQCHKDTMHRFNHSLKKYHFVLWYHGINPKLKRLQNKQQKAIESTKKDGSNINTSKIKVSNNDVRMLKMDFLMKIKSYSKKKDRNYKKIRTKTFKRFLRSFGSTRLYKWSIILYGCALCQTALCVKRFDSPKNRKCRTDLNFWKRLFRLT